MVKEEIKKIIEEAVYGLYHDFQSFENRGTGVLVDVPSEKSHGDYTTNIALVLAKQLQKNPLEVAKQIVSEINHSLIRTNKRMVALGVNYLPIRANWRVVEGMVERVEVAPPGFINFYLANNFFVNNLKEILKNKNFGKNQSLKNKKVIIEYTDPNILKEFHIGHLMSNSIGESISRVLEFQGAKVKRVCYQGDVGLHVAKAIWGKIKNPEKTWGQAYSFGATSYEENETAKKEIDELNIKIYKRNDQEINKLYDQGRKDSLARFDGIYKKLGTRFDHLFFESEVADLGKKIVLDNLKKPVRNASHSDADGGVFEKGDNGAVIFKGEKVGLHTRVFINSDGIPTYEAKDLALPILKQKYFKYDKSVIITANEQNSYFDVMMAALKEVDSSLAEKTTHIGHGVMKLPDGKMSSRTGKVVTFEFLLNEVEKLVVKKIEGRDLTQSEKKEITEKVAIGALKYSILKQSIGKDIIYDAEKSISFEGDSGPYLQYSLTRALSVLQKAKKEGVKGSFKNVPSELSDLERMMHCFAEIVEKAGKELEPHYITVYLTELAREFNNYYANNKIVDKEDKLSPYRVALTEAFSVIMKNGLWLLGISVLNKM